MRASALAAIEAAFLAGWGSPGLLPVQMGNQPFTKPKGLPWGRFAIILGERGPASVSTRFSRTIGFISLQVFIPDDKGERIAATAADAMDGIFRFTRIPFTFPDHTGTVSIEAGSEGPQPTGARDGYAQFNITLPIRIDDTASF